MKRIAIWGVFAGVLAGVTACTSFDPIARGVCGNGLVEAGEDCDSNEASCVSCSVICTSASDCPNSAYACGVDGFCHAPGGALDHQIGAGAFETNAFAVTDIDQDGIGDVLGASRSSIVVRYGDAAGTLASSSSIVTPSQTGSPAFGRLDDDSSLDITVSTPDGIVAYTSPYGTLSPLPIQLLLGPAGGVPVDPRYLFGVTKLMIAGYVYDPTTTHLEFVVVDLANATTPYVTAPCGVTAGAGDLALTDVDTYQVNADGAYPSDFVVSALLGTGSSKKLCVVHIHKDTLLAPPVTTDVTPANVPALTTHPMFADLTADGDPCPSLINTDGGTTSLRAWNGKLTSGHCAFSATGLRGDPLPPLGTNVPNAVVIGHAALSPNFPGLVPDMIVATDGVYSLSTAATPQFNNLYHSTRRLAGVAAGDIDGDGNVDLVMSGSVDDDLDVLYRYGALPAFQLYRIDTASAVTTITIDDYDGDGHADIAYTEAIGDHQRMMIAYGSTDRPLPPVEEGVFAGVTSVARLGLPDSVDLLDTDTDLAVLIPGMPSSFSILHGSPQRTMIPYFDPRSNLGGSSASVQQNTVFRASAIGSFVPAPTGGTPHADLLAIATPKDLGASSIGIRAWAAVGDGTTVDSTTSNGIMVNGVAACGLAQTGECIEDSVSMTWPRGADKDLVLAIDHELPANAVVIDPNTVANAAVGAVPATQLVSAIPTGTEIQSLHVADIDGDGANDLIAVFTPVKGKATTGAVLVCSVDSSGLPQSCTDLMPAITAAVPMTTSCVDAAPGHFGYADRFSTPGKTTDVIVLCKDNGMTIHRVYYEGGAYHAEQLARTASALSQVQVGDVTGDGVDDIVALSGDTGSRSLVVYSQCTSRDLSCQRAAGTGSGSN